MPFSLQVCQMFIESSSPYISKKLTNHRVTTVVIIFVHAFLGRVTFFREMSLTSLESLFAWNYISFRKDFVVRLFPSFSFSFRYVLKKWVTDYESMQVLKLGWIGVYSATSAFVFFVQREYSIQQFNVHFKN